MDKVNIEFTEQEANALIQLLDLACKKEGLRVADSVVHFNNKLQLAFKGKFTEEKSVKEEEIVHEMD